jgi:O-antigen/teichoic acid export membrane protein
VSRLRELLSDSLVYGLSSVVARFLNYLLVPLYTGVFSPAEYGVVGLIYGAIVFLNVIFTMGLESAYIRYASDRERAKDVFKTLQMLLLGASVVFLAVMWLAAPFAYELMGLDGASADRIYMYLFAILFWDAVCVVPYAELRLSERPWIFAGLKTLNVALTIGMNLFLILSVGMGIEAVLLSNAVASAVTGLMVWMVTWPMLRGGWSSGIAKEALWFGLPYVPNGIGFAINEVLDRFWLSRMDPSDLLRLYGEGVTASDITGYYNAVYKLGVFMLLLVQMFRMAWQPFFMKHASATDAPELFGRVFRAFNIGAGVVFLGVALFAADIAAIRIPFTSATLIDARYWSALPIVPWILAAYWFQGWFVIFSVGVFLKDRTKRLPVITWAGAMVTIFANLLLVPMFGMTGAAMATTASYALMSLVLLNDTKKAYPVAYALKPALVQVVVLATLVWLGEGAGWLTRGTCLLAGLAVLLVPAGIGRNR